MRGKQEDPVKPDRRPRAQKVAHFLHCLPSHLNVLQPSWTATSHTAPKYIKINL